VVVVSDRRRARAGANAGQAAQWDGPAGEHRIRHADVFDAEASPLNVRFRAAAGVGPGDRVLDIGCGTGASTRDAARAAVAGSAVGVDLSARMLEHARRAARDEGLRNVTYRQADAQVHRFEQAPFDLCISRFGGMFFADPVAAFANIGRALRPGARLVLMAWQAADRNEWSAAIRQALTTGTPAPPVSPPAGPHPFTLADPAVAGGILAAAGFTAISFTDVRDPVYYGPHTAACDVVLGLRSTRDLLASLDADSTGHALARLRAALAEHDTGHGVYFGSRAWIITGRRP
jgi:SAM-dependent methyltransferase